MLIKIYTAHISGGDLVVNWKPPVASSHPILDASLTEILHLETTCALSYRANYAHQSVRAWKLPTPLLLETDIKTFISSKA